MQWYHSLATAYILIYSLKHQVDYTNQISDSIAPHAALVLLYPPTGGVNACAIGKLLMAQIDWAVPDENIAALPINHIRARSWQLSESYRLTFRFG